MIRKRRVLIRGALVLAAAAIALPAGTAAAIAPGDDYFETDPQSTFLDLGVNPGFFDPGSDPFFGRIKLGGLPLNLGSLGDADTSVRRLAAANVSPGGPPQNVPIEIVQLNLVSIEPVTVTYGGGRPELWDVRAALPPNQPQPHGQMQIAQTSPQGGTFDSFLPVQPRLTFTRLSDGATRIFDAPQIQFNAQGSPWRAGCVLPAQPLSNVFCPGLTPEPRKVLTIEQTAFAAHGVYPAQPNLEHFKCYKLQKRRFKPRKVTLTDQFGQRRTKVRRRAEFCTPVQKNQEIFQNRRAHLQCYSVGGPELGLNVAVRNQFGSQRLLVGGPQRLCLPTRKDELARRVIGLITAVFTPKQIIRKVKPPKITVPIDHYQCYGVQATTPLRTLTQPGQLTLVDQFHRETVQLGDPFRLCAPTAKNRGFIQHPVRHLLCYRIRSKKFRSAFGIQNQFGRAVLVTRKPQSLCVPTLKTRF